MQRQLHALALVTVLFSSGCPGCDPDELNRSLRRIAVDVCAEPKLSDKGGVDDCNLDFGMVDVSARVSKEILLSNISDTDIQIHSYRITEDSDPAFAVDYIPTGLKAGLSAKMTVSFGPMLESTVEGKIILGTDAENASNPEAGQITIHVHGGGANNGLPHLRVQVLDQERDTCCDLGLVAKGTAANCRMRLTNVGSRALVLHEVSLVASATDGPWAPVGALPTDPANHEDDARFTIEPGESSTITYRFEPLDFLPHAAQVLLRTNAPRSCGPVGAFDGNQCNPRDYPSPCPAGEVGVVKVNLRAQGIGAPRCVARIKAVNGSSTFDPRLIEPLDDVQLTAEDSVSSAPGINITNYTWTISRRPPGSRVMLDDPTSRTPRFVFENSSTVRLNGLDVAGEYEARCQVTDSRGIQSINDNESRVMLAAFPTEGIHVQLVWDTPDSDVDLHLIRENPPGTFNAAYPKQPSKDDCNFLNCPREPVPEPGYEPEDQLPPIWDSTNPAHRGGNPVMDVDDQQGYGPENVNIEAPLAGQYLVRAYFYAGHQQVDTEATIRVHYYGNLVAEHAHLLVPGDNWDVGKIVWSASGAPSWEPIDQIVSNIPSGEN